MWLKAAINICVRTLMLRCLRISPTKLANPSLLNAAALKSQCLDKMAVRTFPQYSTNDYANSLWSLCCHLKPHEHLFSFYYDINILLI